MRSRAYQCILIKLSGIEVTSSKVRCWFWNNSYGSPYASVRDSNPQSCLRSYRPSKCNRHFWTRGCYPRTGYPPDHVTAALLKFLKVPFFIIEAVAVWMTFELAEASPSQTNGCERILLTVCVYFYACEVLPQFPQSSSQAWTLAVEGKFQHRGRTLNTHTHVYTFTYMQTQSQTVTCITVHTGMRDRATLWTYLRPLSKGPQLQKINFSA
jgi:hypothetical protein